MELDVISEAIDLAARKLEERNFTDAETICDQLLKVDPLNTLGMYLLSMIKGKLGKSNEALEILGQLEEHAGGDSDLHNSIGLAYMQARHGDKAASHFLKSIRLNPDNSSAWSNLACHLKSKKQYEEAIELLKISFEIKNDPQTLVNLAGVHAELLQLDESIEHLRKAREIDPNLSSACVDLGCALHLTEHWTEAWQMYKSRFEHFPMLKEKIKTFPAEKIWDGKEIENKKVLVFSEQGIGDAINFVRLAKNLSTKFPTNQVEVLVPYELRSFINQQGIKTAESIEGFDLYCSMMDLPFLLELSKKDISDSFWKFESTKTCNMSHFKDFFKIGICWAGNPMHPKDEFRSCKLSEFRKLQSISGVKLFSLQKDTRPRVWGNQKKAIDLGKNCEDMRVVNMAPYMGSWEETAAIINSLDMVISVDTSVMHMSAALGKETWGLLSRLPDWRWGLNAEKSYWYPSLKLFRQKESSDWADVFSDVYRDLTNKLSSI